MTVGIAVVIPGGVAAIADGRTSKVFENEVISDSTQKVVQAAGTTVIVFGVTEVTRVALARMRMADMAKSGAEAVTLARACLEEAWREFVRVLPGDIDRTSDDLRAALLVAGIDGQGPFIGGAMVSFDGPIAVGPACNEYSHIVLGAEKYGSSERFVKEMNEAKGRFTAAESPIAIGNKVVDAAATTIRAMAELDRTVGGQIHYQMRLANGEVISAHL